ncbi:MAG: L,D-transpeptidase [Rudaea sp.]
MLVRLLGIFCVVWASYAFAAAAIDPDPGALRRGEFVWHPEISPAGPMVVIVSLDEQRAYVYRNGIAIGASTISSGRKGHETPPGVFTILQKQVEHYSNRYDDAPMPYMERLTWDGVAMHAGKLPGYPASHGCIRLPQAFARKLFDTTARGVTVVVANSQTAPIDVVHPATLAPIAADGTAQPETTSNRDYTWQDAPLASGPISILVSTADRGVFVFRNAKLIATTHYVAAEPRLIDGSVLYVMAEGYEIVGSTLDPSRPRHRWIAYPLATRADPHPHVEAAGSFQVPPGFARRIYDVLVPGTTLLLTDLPAIRPSFDDAQTRVLESTSLRDSNLK